jgi:hypothetical protein
MSTQSDISALGFHSTSVPLSTHVAEIRQAFEDLVRPGSGKCKSVGRKLNELLDDLAACPDWNSLVAKGETIRQVVSWKSWTSDAPDDQKRALEALKDLGSKDLRNLGLGLDTGNVGFCDSRSTYLDERLTKMPVYVRKEELISTTRESHAAYKAPKSGKERQGSALWVFAED